MSDNFKLICVLISIYTYLLIYKLIVSFFPQSKQSPPILTPSDILSAKEYVKNLHEPLKRITIKYGSCLHARLTGNLRILYRVDSEKENIFFLDILTHDEMDKLR